MTEADARDWCAAQFGDVAVDRLTAYVALLLEEAERQNLIAPSTRQQVWARHIVDCAQLVTLGASDRRQWIDVGSGAGLPGLVIAAISDWSLILVEPRKLRADFLVHATTSLGLASRVDVRQTHAARLQAAPAGIISARAVSSLDRLFSDTRGFSDLSTTFVLPKGASAPAELEIAVQTWQGTFHVEQSITDPAAGIVVATQVRPR